MNHFSATELNLFLRCPFAWHMVHEVGLKLPKTDALFYGIAIHEALDSYYRGKDPVMALERFISSDPSIPSSFDKERFLGQGRALLEAYKTKGLSVDKVISLEERKTVELSHPVTKEKLPVPYTFKIDMICEIGGKNWVVDHKTKQSGGEKQDAFNRIQGILYVMAYRELFGERPEGFIQNGLVANKTPKIVSLPIHYSIEEEIEIWELAKKVLDLIKSREYLDSPPIMHSFYPCPVRLFCPTHGG
jgi:hypothetical protein